MKKTITFKSISALFVIVAALAWLVALPIVSAEAGQNSMASQGVPALLEELAGQMEFVLENQEQIKACLVDRGACAPSGVPDLVPLTRSGSLPIPLPGVDEGLCDFDDNEFFVRVKNQGTARAASSHVGVFFRDTDPVVGRVVAVPALNPEEVAEVSVSLDPTCFATSDCNFQITVDSHNEVDESDERNNSAYGTCLG